MTRTAFPQFKLPEMKLPKFNLDALFSLQKANLAAVQEVQNVLVDAAQAVVKLQYGLMQDAVTNGRAALTSKEAKKPEAVLADVQAVAERAVAVTQQGVDLSVSAHRRVIELLSQRAQANIDELKALAA